MITLHNGCKCSNLSVYPKNWKSKKASVNIDWYIMYRFYDPGHAKPKQVMVKGMNLFGCLPERQNATKKALEEEMNKLINDRFNPFLKVQDILSTAGELTQQTPIHEALKIIYKKITVSARMKMI